MWIHTDEILQADRNDPVFESTKVIDSTVMQITVMVKVQVERDLVSLAVSLNVTTTWNGSATEIPLVLRT